MRIAHIMFAGALASLAAWTSPVLAKNSNAQKAEEAAASSTCSAYQQAPDGSWTQLPCKESGEHDQPQTQHRSAAQGSDHEER